MKPRVLKIRDSLYFLIYLATVIVICSCNRRALNIPEYIQYVRTEENGLAVSTSRNDCQFSLLLEPAEYLTLKELRHTKISEQNFNDTKQKFTDYLYFNFFIKSLNSDLRILDKTDSADYESRFNYFSFVLSEDVYLISRNDTMHCLLHQFTNGGDISPEVHFELMFEKPKPGFFACDSIVFCYDDKVLNAGMIRIPILTKNINRIPQLKI